MDNPILCTYHKDCIDGTAAAAVVLRKYPQALLFPLAHAYTTDDITQIEQRITHDTQIFTVDCGLGVREFLKHSSPVTTIDHHIGGKEQFEEFAGTHPHYTYIFDNEKSGSSLTWSTLFPDESMPELVRYVEDGDLWRWHYGTDSKDVNNYLSMFRNDPQTMLLLIESDISEIKQKGTILSQYADREIQNLIQVPPITLYINNQTHTAYNITQYESACGNILAERQNSVALLFMIKGQYVKFSIRSLDHQTPSALDIATVLGGGGHKNAAGATIPLGEFLHMIQSS